MANDKKTIGISGSNAAALEILTARGRFASELDAAKFGMAYAIKLGRSLGNVEGAETKWNVGSLDPDGSLRSLIEGLYGPCPEPYRAIEYLMNEGIAALGEELRTKPDVYDTLFSDSSSVPADSPGDPGAATASRLPD